MNEPLSIKVKEPAIPSPFEYDSDRDMMSDSIYSPPVYSSDLELTEAMYEGVDEAFNNFSDTYEQNILSSTMSNPTSRTAPFNAEISLINSLKKPRNYHKKVIDNKDLKQTSVLNQNVDLNEFREERDLALEEYREAVASVRSLDNQKISTAKSSTDFHRLKISSEKRKTRHDGAVSDYLKKVSNVSEVLEGNVLKTARDVQDSLILFDQKINNIFTQLDKDSFLVQKDHVFVTDAWNQIENICKDRKQSIITFGEELDKIEQERSATVGGVLQTLVTTLVRIGYVLLPEIERLAEREANEVNLVTIANRRSHADLIARLMKDDVAGLVLSRCHWEKNEKDWRILKHNQAIGRYATTMKSQRFTNPPARVNIFSELRDKQKNRHEKVRVNLLTNLGSLMPPNLTKESVVEIKKEFITLNEIEEEDNASYFQKLQNQAVSLDEECKSFREELRSELHIYGALAPEPDFNKHSQSLNVLVSNPELEEFFRKSGGLKGELKHIENTLTQPTLIYQTHLNALIKKLQIPMAAFDLDEFLDAQGKVGERKNIQSSLEKIRVATKNDIAPLLPILIKQANSFITINNLNPILVSEIKDISDGLTKILNSLPKNRSVTSLRSPASNDSTFNGSKGTSTAGGDSKSGETRSSSRNAKGEKEIHIDMTEIRSITKRLGVCMCATELNKEIKEEIKLIKESLQMKVIANDVIDNVVHSESESLIAERNKEAADLLKLVGLSLQERAAALHEVIEAVCIYYINVAEMIFNHETEARKIDNNSEDTLFALLDKFEEDDKSLEKFIEETLYDLRHAPNNEELEVKFQKALSLIESVEKNYRSYYANVITESDRHPDSVKDEMEGYRQKSCSSFGMVFSNEVEESNTTTNSTNETSTEESEAEIPAWQSKFGTIYKTKASIKDIAERFWKGPSIVPPPVVTAPVSIVEEKVQEDIAPLEPEVKGKPNKNAKQQPAVVTEAPPPSEVSVIQEVKTEVVENIAEEEKEPLRPIPTDENGIPCLEDLEIPINLLVDNLTKLRNEIFNQLEEQLKNRMEMALKLKSDRQSGYTTELEERLRKHWPRRGRTDVITYQPREGELTTHKQRYERHVRSLLLKNSSHATQFETVAKESESSIDKYLERQEMLENALERQSNLAALQGIFKKGKDFRAEFKVEAAERTKRLIIYQRDEPARLLTTNPEFIKTCKLFADGGDYNVVEVKQAEEALKAAATVVEEEIEKRKLRIEVIRNKEREALSSFAKFSASFEQCLQDLSMRDGLGQKYGGPRRNAQERLRSEFSRSDIQGENIDASLTDLERFCQEEPGSETHEKNLSYRIKKSLIDLRLAIVSRAIYLNFVGEGQTLTLPFVSAEDEVVKDDPAQGTITPLPVITPFMQVAEEAAIKCRSETKTLYINEGKEAALGATGVPDALKKYLDEQLSKVKSHREESAHNFRDQVNRLTEILQTAPSVVLLDNQSWSKSISIKSRKEEEEKFSKKRSVLEAAKAKHKQDLKPQLSSPNAIAALNALVAAESNRFQDAKKGISYTLKRLLLTQSNLSENFTNKLLFNIKSLQILLDSIPSSDQLGYLPGDENIIHKRKGLKKLQYDALKKGESKTNGVEKVEIRSWPGIDLVSLDLNDELKLLFVETPVKGAEPEKVVAPPVKAPEPPAKGAKGKGGKEAAVVAAVVEQVTTPTGPVSPPYTLFGGMKVSEPISLKLTPASRALLKNRNVIFEEFVANYHSGQREIFNQYNKILKEEEVWFENWNKMVSFLKNQS